MLVCPFDAAWRDPGPDRGRLRASLRNGAIMVVAVAGGPVGCQWTRLVAAAVALAAASSVLLSQSRPSRKCVTSRFGPPATGSGPTRPAGYSVAGRRPWYPSRIRVERAVTGQHRPAGSLPVQVYAAGRPEHHHRAGGKDRNSSIGPGIGHHELRTEKSTVTSVSSS